MTIPIISGDRKTIWLRYLGARAYDNTAYVAACNLIGENGSGQVFSGGALVIGPKGDITDERFNSHEELLVCEISAERLNHLRRYHRTSMKESFFLADRRKELYRELIELDVRNNG